MNMTIPCDGGLDMPAYQATSEFANGYGVVLLHEIFGVTPHMTQLADRYADIGYKVVVPALFERVATGVSLSYQDHDRGRELAALYTPDAFTCDIDSAVSHLRASLKYPENVAVVGFCWGGTFDFLAACHLRIECAISYYGTRVATLVDQKPPLSPKSPLMFHFGEQDSLISIQDRTRVNANYSDCTCHTYLEAGHAFTCEPGSTFHRASADLAWQRSKQFLPDNLD